MKRHILAFLFMFNSVIGAFAQFTEDFSDGDFTANPVWTSSNVSGNGVDFQVNSGELQSAGPAATATLSITTQGVPSLSGNEIVWEFNARYNNAPSSSNNIEIYLLSDISDLTGSPQGYYIRLGETGSDDGIDFFKTSSGTALITDPNPSVATTIDVSIRVTRDDLGNWLLEADPAGGTSYSTIGSVSDTEFLSGDHFGFKVDHTSTRNMDFFFDNISVTATNTDVTPPTITSAEIIEPNQLILTFNESIESTTSETIGNYLLNNGYGNPTSASLTTSNQVTLIFSSTLIEANYTITVNNVQDLNGNAIGVETFDFTYSVPDVAELRDVIINEIMADPSPIVGLPEAEFVELYNQSTKTLDLANWTFADATSTATLPSFALNPGSYVILTSNANASLFTGFGDVIGVSSLPSLNNTGDKLTLKNESDVLIDYVNYDDSWYQNEDKIGNGYTLELINPNNVCGGIDNWRVSEDAQGGTPGAENSVFNTSTGTELPTILNIVPTSSNEVLVEFSEPLDTLSVELADFGINGIAISSYGQSESIIEFTLADPLSSGTEYTFTVTTVDDCTGNTVASLDFIFQYLENPALNYKDVVITEIMANPNDETSLPNAEFVEIQNLSSSQLNLSGWQFSDGSSSGILGYYILDPSEYLVLTKSSNVGLFDPSIPVLELNTFPSLNNTGDNITLKNNNDQLLDSVAYKSSWYRSSIKDDGGFSLEIIDPDNVCSGELNWIATEDVSGGTPGKQNSVYAEIIDNMGPKLLSAFGITSDTVLVSFDEEIDADDLIPTHFSISDGIIVDQVISDDLVTVFLILNGTTPILGNKEYTLTISNVFDCPGNQIQTEFSSLTFSLIEEAELGDLLINEILFNPRSGGVDFVELVNTSSKYVSLKDWQIANADDFIDSLELKTEKIISESYKVLSPGELLALTSDAFLLKDQYPKSSEENYLELSSLPSYPDDEGTVVLLNPAEEIVDYFTYSEDFHSKVINDDEGVSLERISTSQATNIPENWFSAAASENFATPGYMNSQSRESITNQTGEILIDPKVIIPDGDGIDDYATISYSFNQSGYVISVTVMDLYGREIKKIATNDFVSTEGFYTWDGSDNDGKAVRIGYYIIYVEAFNASGSVEKFKEKVVIGTRF